MIPRPVTILVLAANPSNTARLGIDREVREIDQRLRCSEQRDAFRVEQAWAVRIADLQACLLRHQPTIVHFSGHGSAAGELLFEDEVGGAAAASPAALARLFEVLGADVRCVVLNACFSEAQARVIACHVDSVVGMSRAIRDEDAIAFAGSFYQALGYGKDLQAAFDLGCQQTDLRRLAHADVPRLFVRPGLQARAVRFAAEPPPPRATSRAGATLHQLRAPPADFTGRGEELADLRARLSAGGVIIAGLTGQGGVGKTSLALVLAQELRERYPDAQIDLDLRGASAEPLTPSQAMAEVIRAFEPEAKLPPDADALGRVYRSVLDGRRALLLLDNARDRAQVEPLIPPQGCLLLITSRQHVTLPGIYTRRLDVLDPDQAAGLIRRIAPRLDQESAGELAQFCGYLPLALRVAARTLAERVTLKPARYIARLRHAQDRLAEVDAVLGESLALIDPAARVFWLRLGVFPGDFDQGSAAAVGELSLERAEALLEELVRWSLLEWDHESERYRSHDLARDHALSHVEAEEEVAARRRHAKHFLELAAAACELYKDGGAGMLDGLALFDRERANIEAAQMWAKAHEAVDEVAATVCCDLPLRAAYLLVLRQHPRERIVWLEAALDAARRLEDRGNEGALMGNLGVAHADAGDPRRAIEVHEQRLVIAREIGDRRGEGNALGNLGNAYYALGEIRRAISCYEQRLAIARELGDGRGEGHALGNLGNAYYSLGEIQRAITYHEQHLVIAREIGDTLGEALTSWNLGLAYERLGEPARAIELMQAHVDVERALGHPDAEEHDAILGRMRGRSTT